MISWPVNLIDSIARRRCIVVLGSGVSANSVAADGITRPPTWKGFLEHAIERCPGSTKHVRELVKSGDYLTACDIIKHRLDDQWIPLIRSTFVDPKFEAAEIHSHLFDLDCRIVITPNFDKIYDTFAVAKSGNTITVKSYLDQDVLDVANGYGRYIFKVHGDVNNPHQLVFTRQQYAEARVTKPSVYKLLEALLLTNSFLFVGCGVSDPDFNLMLEDYRFSNIYAAPHYITMQKKVNADISRVLRNTRNLKVLEYDKDVEHKQLSESLRLLAREVQGRRAELARATEW